VRASQLGAALIVLGCGSSGSPPAAAPAPDGGDASSEASISDSAGPPVDAQPLCDGTERVRFHALVAADTGRERRGSSVRVELGSPFLVVDGACRYWISGGWLEDELGRDRPLRTGKLSESEAEMLEHAIPLDELATLNDCKPVAGQFDVSLRALRTEQTSARCGSSGPRFDAAWLALESISGALWAKAAPLDGALHLSAVEAPNDLQAPKPYPWPLAIPLSSFVLELGSDGQPIAPSSAVADPDSANQLRALRVQYLDDRSSQPGIYVNWDGMAVTQNGVNAWLYMRDAIPYENAQGGLSF
jgi:hypothetical protein